MNETDFKMACIESNIDMVMLLINISRKKPYNKMFNIYILEKNPVFNMMNYEQLFIYMASCGTYKQYDNNYKFII